MMLTLVAFVLVSTSVFAQTQKSVKDPNVSPAPRAAELGRAVGDDCSNPIVVDINTLPFNFTDNSQTTCGHGNTYETTTSYTRSQDIIYKVNTQEDAPVTFTMDPKGQDYTYMALFRGCPEPTAAGLVKEIKYGSTITAKSFTETLDPGVDYYLMIDYWPTPGDCVLDFDLTITSQNLQPKLVSTVDPIDLGEWPVNGWQECRYVRFKNEGDADATITGIELDDPNNVFRIVDPVGISTTVGMGDTETLSKLKGRPGAAGTYTGQYVVTYGKSRAAATVDINMTAYDAPVGDIFENPIVVNSFPYAAAGASTAAPMRKNYFPNATEAGKDVVYKFTLASDKEVDVTISNHSDDFGLVLYAADFEGKPGPMMTNPMEINDPASTNFTDLQLFAGDYYLVVTGVNAASDITYDINIDAVDMAAPAKPINPSPANLATNVNANGTVATWEYDDELVKQYRVYFGNTLPLTEVLSWTDADENPSFALPNMDPNMQYFWRVDVRNDHNETEGDVWIFTTQLTTPTNLTTQVTGSPADDVSLNWELDAPRIFRYFKVYRNGALIADNITETSYQDMNVAHGCYDYQVEAVYDEGTSAKSDVAQACIYGNGTHHGVVKDAYTSDVIEGVTITYEGVDGSLAEDHDYVVTTDANGYYELEAHEGLYDITVSADGYVSQNSQDVLVTYDVDGTRNYFLTEKTDAVTAEIKAIEVGDNVEVIWETRGDRALKGYNVYRVHCYDNTQSEFLGYTLDKRFTDHNWSTVSANSYKWGIEAVYDAGTSPMAYSNCLDKDMLTAVNVKVTTNSGDSPAGAKVIFTNVSEPDLNLVYVLNIDDTGVASISDFRKGTYDIKVKKAGFEPITQMGEVIISDANFEWELQELNGAPINLWVSPLGYAQWELPFGEGVGDGTMIHADFEDGMIPADWTIEDIASSAGLDLWHVTNSYTRYGTTYELNGTYFAFIDSDIAGSGTTVSAALVSPEVNNATAANVTLEFDQFYRPYGGFGDVDVWDGAAWQTVLHQTIQAGDWSNADHQSIDVTAYKNANFKVRFNYYGSWAYYWAVDNVKVFDNTRGATASSDRVPEHYQVWLEGNFADNTNETHYQHDVTPLTLGESYTTEVNVVYTTGVSAKASYTWTYLDCDHFQHPVSATTDYDPQHTPDFVTVNWTNNASVAGAVLTGVNLYRDGDMIAFVEAPATTYADSTNTGLLPGNAYEYCFRAVYTNDGGNHTWLSCEGTTCTTFDMPEILPAPINLTATIVDTTNVALSWELPANSSDYTFQSYTVYRDGAVLATGLTTTTYTNINLPLGCYTYEVEAVYAEGISPKSVEAEVCIKGTATVKGMVTDLTTGLPIEGATVTLDGDVDYTFTTNADGMYEGEVWQDEYNYTVTADAYQSQILTDVVVGLNAVVVKDFALDDEYQSVGNILAVELNPSTVKVIWDGSAAATGTWLDYGVTESNGTLKYSDADDGGFVIAHKYPAGSMNPYAGGTITKVKAYIGDAPNSAKVKIWQGATLVYEQDVTANITANAWNEFMLATPVSFDVAQDLMVGIDFYLLAGQSSAGYLDPATNANADWVNVDGAGWKQLAADYGWNISWSMGMYVTDGAKGTYVPMPVLVDNTDYSNQSTPQLQRTPLATPAKDPYTNVVADREVTGYNIYRVKCFDTSNPVFLGSTPDSSFSDHNWGDVPFGNYKWGVERLYTNGVSEMAYSNCIDKDMLTSVSVTVTTNSGDSPAGAKVTLTNISEPTLNWKHTFVLDDTGMATCDTIRKGVYDIEVSKYGFESQTESNIVIESSKEFEWMLIEQFFAPLDLWVSPTGYAVWKSPIIDDTTSTADGINADFNNGMPAGWTVEDNGSTAGITLWEVVSNYKDKTLDGTPFAFIDSDAAGSGKTLDAYLVSPVVDNSADANVTLQFDQNYQHIIGFGFSAVEVWNGSEWVEVLKQEDDVPISSTGLSIDSWNDGPNVQTLDLTAHKNANFQVRFRYVGSWAWYWALDNIKVFDNSKTQMADRGVQSYKVWLDGVYEADTPNTWYQHNVEGLTPGTDYTTEVAVIFSTGISDKVSYTWTYVPCDQYEAPIGIFAEGVEGTENAHVYWSDLVANLSAVNITQGYGDPGNGWYQKYNSGYGVVYDLSAYPDALINMTKYHHTSWGTTGIWDYKVHIVNWDTKTIISTAGPFQTTGDDQWEDNIALGDVATGGATQVAILVEPLSNSPDDAYPCLSADGDANAMGSILVQDLNDIAGTFAGNNDGAAPVGRYLMEMTILTSNAKGGSAVVKPMTVSNTSVASQARVSNKSLAAVKPMIKQEGNLRDAERIGANLYRDGEFLAFIPAPDTSYVDEGLEIDNTYRYCVAAVYTNDGGLHTWTSCLDAVCTKFTMPEACEAPVNLTVTDVSGDGKKITLNWRDPIDPVWLDYGVTGSTGTLKYSDTDDGGFIMAHKHPAGSMNAYEGAVITKVKAYIGDVPNSAKVKIWQGAGASTLIYEQDVTSGITANAWNEFVLTTPVSFDVAQDLMVGVDLYLLAGQSSGGYTEPSTDANADWVYLEGLGWKQLVPDFGWDISWSLGFYVDNAKGSTEPMPVLVNSTDYTNQAAPNLARTSLAVPAVDPFTNAAAQADRGFLGYNVYRDGVQVNTELVTENTYVEMNLPGGVSYCWKVSAEYETCGESDFSNEVCKEIYEGVDEFNNNVNIYPNPAKEYVKISASSVIEQIRITNMAGQLVRHMEAISATNTTIDTQDLGAGVYFVEVNTINGAKKVKLVITK